MNIKNIITFCLLLAGLSIVKAQDLIPFEEKGKMGFKNNEGKVVVEPWYEYPTDFHDGLLSIIIDYKVGFTDANGKIVIPCIYKAATNFYKGRAVVQLEKKIQIIDVTGKVVKELPYNGLGWSREDVTNVGMNGKYGRIEIATGKEIIPPIYDGMPRFSKSSYSRVRIGEKWGIIDKVGNVKLPLEYDNVNLHDDAYTAKKGEKYGVGFLDFKEPFELQYDSIAPFDYSFALVKRNNLFGYIDYSGKEVIPVKYLYAASFSEYYGIAIRDASWFILDKTGAELRVQVKYDGLDLFNDGMCMVMYNDKYGFINTKGEQVVAPIYESVYRFMDGFAKVKLEGKVGAINKNGKVVVPLTLGDFNDIKYFTDGVVEVINGDKTLYYNNEGKLIKKPEKQN